MKSRVVYGRVMRWARFVAYSQHGAHVQTFVRGYIGPSPIVDGVLYPRAAEARALEATR